MRKLGIIGVLSMLLVAFSASVALAQNPHFIGNVVCTDVGTQLSCSGKVAGLGEEPVDVVITAQGTATIECFNPGNKEESVPGQDTTLTVTGESGPITPRNGQITFTNVTTETPVVSGEEACPNPQWTAVVTDVEFTSATVSVFDLAGNLLTETTAVLR